MYRLIFILIAYAGLSGCVREKYRNTVLQEVDNIAHNSKATIFLKDGDVSVLTYNVSILNDNYSLTNSDRANVFSFTYTDTSNVNSKNNMISMIWTGKTELEITHPQIGTVWKNDSSVIIDGISYKISYRIK